MRGTDRFMRGGERFFGVVVRVCAIPRPPSPAPPPAQPTDLRVALEASSGELTLLWKASNPGSGTAYIVRRKLPGETEFSFIGVTGEKKFTDKTLFADSVQYTVQGQRANSTGPVSTILTVNFGRAGGGGFTISSQSQGGGGGMSQAA